MIEKKDNLESFHYSFFSVSSIVLAVKLLLIPAYFSTDFEVHRNWMAITWNKPISQWYTENTSQWTLDYPPFFAYFELFLAFFARYFDAGMLRISAEPYTSSQTIVYQRLTVILSDVVFNYAAYLWIQELIHNQRLLSGNVGMFARVKPKICSSPAFILSTLFLFNVAHLIVDHIHFQYNGLLNGLLLLSMLRMVQERIYWSSFWFAVLLNFKHIYLYMAPAYFVFLLANYCLRDRQIQWKVIFKLAAVVLSVFAASFAPFIMRGQLFVLLARLFPFQRGLSHAYWAPNLWACYNGLDIILSKLFKLSNGSPTKAKSLTSGLVQQNEHQFLPTITPRTSIVCVVAVIGTISAIYIWIRLKRFQKKSQLEQEQKKRALDFLQLTLISTLTFFSFGYHVHEKAILLVLPAMVPLFLVSVHFAAIFLFLSTVGIFSLFPLLFQPAETPIKVIMLLLHVLLTNEFITCHCPNGPRKRILTPLETLYLVQIVPLQLFSSVCPYLVPSLFDRYPFVPLMLISLYCSVGVLYSFARLVCHFIGSL